MVIWRDILTSLRHALLEFGKGEARSTCRRCGVPGDAPLDADGILASGRSAGPGRHRAEGPNVGLLVRDRPRPSVSTAGDRLRVEGGYRKMGWCSWRRSGVINGSMHVPGGAGAARRSRRPNGPCRLATALGRGGDARPFGRARHRVARRASDRARGDGLSFYVRSPAIRSS